MYDIYIYIFDFVLAPADHHTWKAGPGRKQKTAQPKTAASTCLVVLRVRIDQMGWFGDRLNSFPAMTYLKGKALWSLLAATPKVTLPQ